MKPGSVGRFPNRLVGRPLLSYVETAEGWLYVAGILDRCTRRCVGWAMGESLAATLPLVAPDMALKQRQRTAGLVHHSDRGVQYASAAYLRRLAQTRDPQHEPPGQLLRQRREGKLLEQPQTRTGVSLPVRHAGRSEGCDL